MAKWVGVLSLFATLGMGCRGCGGCGGSCVSTPIFSCEPLPFDSPDAPSFIIDGGMRPDVIVRDAPFSTMDVPRESCDYIDPGSNIGSYCGDGCAAPYECSALSIEVDATARDVTPAFCSAPCRTLELHSCGPCARCVASLPLGVSRLELGTADPIDGQCAPQCVPSLRDRGTCLPGFTCEWAARVCVPACAADADCALVRGEDGAFTTLPDGAARCDVVSGRCVREEPVEPPAPMSPCTSDLDCAVAEHCFHDPLWAEGVGVCLQLECELDLRACPDGQWCERLDAGTACRLTCESDLDCPDHLRCDTSAGTCWRGCAADADCASGEACTSLTGGPCEDRCACRVATMADSDAGVVDDAGMSAPDADPMDGGVK